MAERRGKGGKGGKEEEGRVTGRRKDGREKEGGQGGEREMAWRRGARH